MKKYLQFFIPLIIVIAVLLAVFISEATVHEKQLSWMIYFYFCILTLLFHFGIVQTTKSRPQVFIRYYMASTTIKLFLHLGIIVIYSIFNRPDAMRFILTFMAFYFVFTTFEVAFMLQKKKKDTVV